MAPHGPAGAARKAHESRGGCRKTEDRHVRLRARSRRGARPPFLFQGFIIRSPDEIEMLRRYCRTVYILKGEARAQCRDPARSATASTTYTEVPPPTRTTVRPRWSRRSSRSTTAPAPGRPTRTAPRCRRKWRWCATRFSMRGCWCRRSCTTPSLAAA
ncbi:MAG: DUF3391 domain-containing protein [Comamonadaceae bacterium]|nr:DUF3391 domain-containing protein [Comamonadaceae bacterium]